MKLLKQLLSVIAIFLMLIYPSFAITLSDYPKPFVQNGQFDGYLVIGNQAAAEDVIGVSGIASSLQYATIGVKTIEEAQSEEGVTGGDVWQIKTSTKDFDISGNDEQIENINNIVTSIGGDELKPLKEIDIRTDKGTATYQQFINFENTKTEYVMLLKDEDDNIGDYLYIKNGDNIITYEMDFSKALKSDIKDDTVLEDVPDTKLYIMGKEYTISEGSVSKGGTDVSLTLMGGNVKAVMDEGTTQTFKVNEIDYEVTVTLITDSETDNKVKFIVNGEVTDALKEGETYELSDGTEIGVTEILPNEAGEAKADMVEFRLGATKLILTNGDEMEINEDSIDDTLVTIDSTNDGKLYTINNIQIKINANDDIYVQPGHSVSSYLEEPKAMLLFDLVYNGLEEKDIEDIAITGGDQSKELTFTDADSKEVNIPLVYADGSTLLIGNDDEKLIFTEGENIIQDSYFILANGDDSYALQYVSSKDNASSAPIYKFKVLGGSTLDVDYSKITGVGNIRLGGNDYKVIPANGSSINNDNFDIYVDLNGDGSIGSNTVSIKTKAEAIIEFEKANNTLVTKIRTDTKNVDTPYPTDIKYSMTASSDDINLNRVDNYSKMVKDGDIYTGYTTYGARIDYDSDSDELQIEYPVEQRLALVYGTVGNVQVSYTEKNSTTTKKTTTNTLINKISVTATKLASEVSDVTNKNIISVGGPCANTVTSTLMGTTGNCAEGFTDGKAKIKMYSNNGKEQIVVAGYSASDTRNACAILADYEKYDLRGNDLEITTSNLEIKEAVQPTPTPSVTPVVNATG